MVAPLLVAAATSLWLGILTSVSPCPLTTNILAVSWLARDLGRPGRVLLAGGLYAAGRAVACTLLAAVLLASVVSVPVASRFLTKYMNQILGPVLLLTGMALLGLLRVKLPAPADTGGRLRERLLALGIAGSFLLGALFALSFCPVSAWLFFGSLFPLALKHESAVLLPALYGVGTALPALAAAAVLTGSAERASRLFEKTRQAEAAARRITGIAFLAVGLWYCLAYTAGLAALWR